MAPACRYITFPLYQLSRGIRCFRAGVAGSTPAGRAPRRWGCSGSAAYAFRTNPGPPRAPSIRGEREVADDRVVETLGPRPVLPDVVSGPQTTELVGARRQLPHQLRDAAVVRILPDAIRSVATACAATVSRSMKNSPRVRVEEQEAQHVRAFVGEQGCCTARVRGGWPRAGRCARSGRRRGWSPSGRATSARWAGRSALADAPLARWRDGRTPRGPARPGRCALGLVEPEGVGQGVQHLLGDAGEVAALQARVVVGADAGEQRDLLAAQPRDPSVAAPRGQAGLLGGDPGAPGDQEVAGPPPCCPCPDRRRRASGEPVTDMTGLVHTVAPRENAVSWAHARSHHPRSRGRPLRGPSGPDHRAHGRRRADGRHVRLRLGSVALPRHRALVPEPTS